jgi:predicted transcriptional regulator
MNVAKVITCTWMARNFLHLHHHFTTDGGFHQRDREKEKAMRTLTITSNPDWKAALRVAAQKAENGLHSGTYQGETLNFETPGAFFSRLTERRWNLVSELLGSGTVGVRELARRLGRDVKRVHEDAAALIELGLIEKDERGALLCPYENIHVDMVVARQAA